MKGRCRGHLQSEGLSLCFCFRLKSQPFCTMAALNEAHFAQVRAHVELLTELMPNTAKEPDMAAAASELRQKGPLVAVRVSSGKMGAQVLEVHGTLFVA